MKKYTLKDLLLPERQRQATEYFVKNLSRRPPAYRSVIRRPRSPEEVQLLSEVFKRDFERLQQAGVLEIDGRTWKFQGMQKFSHCLDTLKTLSDISFHFQNNNVKLIVVGGRALELYSFGHYKTIGIDVVISDLPKASELLKKIGFENWSLSSNCWYHHELGIPIQIHNSILEGSKDKMIEVSVDASSSFHVIGVEDLIFSRAQSAIDLNAPRDGEWALLMMETHKKRVDFTYLEERVQSEPNPLLGHLILDIKSKLLEYNEK